MINYILGLDIGIGSVGWAVINIDKRRIEDFGVRIFDSGELKNGKDRKSQQRRGNRAQRRLIRRKSHRKNRLKNYLEKIGLVSVVRVNDYFETKTNNVIELRYKALTEKLSPEEIAACLIHICNNRGYKKFYDIPDDETELDEKELKEEMDSLEHFDSMMKKGGYRTPAEMILKDKAFDEPNSVFRKFHNSDSSEKMLLISREMVRDEVKLILDNQKKYYKCLDDKKISIIMDIIFAQRDFETGPGQEGDTSRKFTSYLDTLGKCRFYKDKDRGSRFTAIADIYSLVNVLSQYKFVTNDGEPYFTGDLAYDLINTALQNGALTKTNLNKILKSHGLKLLSADKKTDEEFKNCFKYIKIVKPVFEKFGFDWSELIKEYTDTENNLLNKVGIVLSQSQTPSRRIKKLKGLECGLEEELIKSLARIKFSGTANVCYEYMSGCIEAFLEGEIYGKYQDRVLKSALVSEQNIKPDKLPPFKNEDDCEFFKNPVVFRSINETRKLINSIIDQYGHPNAVNLETADELNKKYEDRLKDENTNKRNQKEKEQIIKDIRELLDDANLKVSSRQIEKYRLWKSQNGMCLYSGTVIEKSDLRRILKDDNRETEIDHIIPYSLILDNTLNNKALVLMSENQKKGQNTPLMYMNDEKASEFRKRVNILFKDKKISKKKYAYLMTNSLEDCELLDEWKSRNLNDTRYISKYLVNYLRSNLKLNDDDKALSKVMFKDSPKVFAVKSSFTSMFRKQWLNYKTWGRPDKDELKNITLLDHAADAIVIANCRPEYIIIAGEKQKLYKIWRDAGKRETEEYRQSKQACIDSLFRYYHIPKDLSEKLLSGSPARLKPIVPKLWEEADKRLWDKNICEKIYGFSEEELARYEEIYRANMKALYYDDPEFVSKLQMPVISYKPDRKYRGEITDNNPVSVKEIDGVMYQLRRVSISDVSYKHIDSIYSDDEFLFETLHRILDDKANIKDYTVGKYLKDNNLPFFTTDNGTRINKVTLKSDPGKYVVKEVADNNKTILSKRHYYTVEVYLDNEQRCKLHGIAMSDVIRCNKTKKIWLRPDYKYPDDYGVHVMYLFKGDYIRILQNDDKVKCEGYFVSARDLNKNRVNIKRNNESKNYDCWITQNDRFIKLSVDMLGKIHGENSERGISCGEQLLLPKEKN